VHFGEVKTLHRGEAGEQACDALGWEQVLAEFEVCVSHDMIAITASNNLHVCSTLAPTTEECCKWRDDSHSSAQST
jgi:hypothetical protein